MLNLVRSSLTKRCYATTSTVTSTKSKLGTSLLTSTSAIPVSYLNAYIKAGSRHQNQPGLIDYLRNYCFQYTNRKTGLRMIRETELQGAELSVNTTREHLVLRAKCFPRDVPYFVQLFSDVLTQTKFQDYLTIDLSNNVNHQLKELTVEKSIFDSLHQIAFRRGLGNPLHFEFNSAPKTADVEGFLRSASNPQNTLIVGINVDKNVVVDYENKWQVVGSENTAAPISEKTTYYGGEQRIRIKNPRSYLAIGFEGFPIFSQEYAALCVLRAYLSGDCLVKWGTGVGPISKIVNGKKYKNSYASAYNMGYSDSGLFSIYITSPKASIKDYTVDIVTKVSETFKNFGEKELNLMRNKAKMEFLSQYEDTDFKPDIIALQGSHTTNQTNPDEFAQLFDTLKIDQVKKVIDKLKACNISVAAFGDDNYLPYKDEIEALLK